MPLANELKAAIIAEVLPDPGEQALVADLKASREPFELFIQRIGSAYHPHDSMRGPLDLRDSFIGVLASLFADERAAPCTSHVFLARLLVHRLITTILTTNFDVLLERAAEPGKIVVLSEEEEFEQSLEIYGNLPHILKIHGSADRPRPLVTLLESVSMKIFVDIRRRALARVFADGPHTGVAVLGYSCSDIFDLMPAIADLSGALKEVTVVRHSDRAELALTVEPHRYPFERYPGVDITCNTDELLRFLWESCVDILGPYQDIAAKSGWWTTRVAEWGNRLRADPRIRPFTAGMLCKALPRYDDARRFLQESRNASRANCSPRLEYESLINLAETNYYFGDLQHALESASGAQEVCRCVNALGGMDLLELGFVPTQAQSRILRCVARMLIATSNFADAAKRSEQALKIEKEIGFDPEALFDAISLCCLSYSHMNELTKAAEMCGELVDRAEGRGSPEWKMTASYCLGQVHGSSGRLLEAVEAYQSALRSADTLGDLYSHAEIRLQLGDVFEQGGVKDLAISSYEDGLLIAQRIQAKLLEAQCCTNLGYAYFGVRDLIKSLKYHQMALSAEQSVHFRPREGLSYLNIGSVYASMDEYAAALEHYHRAESVLTETGQRGTLGELYKNMSLAYSRLGQSGKASRYLRLQWQSPDE